MLDAISRQSPLEGNRSLERTTMSFDISNAFNILPSVRIREALRHHRMSSYLRRIVGIFLEGRQVIFQAGTTNNVREK